MVETHVVVFLVATPEERFNFLLAESYCVFHFVIPCFLSSSYLH